MAKKVIEATQLAFETSIRVDIREILPNPYQPPGRIVPPKEALDRIVASIEEHGLIQTPVVRRRTDGKYEMGDGWIRRCAYLELSVGGNSKYSLLPVNIRELSDRQMADLIVEANMVRLDLSPIDLALFYVKYLEDFGITQAELARLHHCSQGEIANTIRLLDLPPEIQSKVISQEISETHARSLLQLGDRLDDKKRVNKLVAQIVEQHASVADIDREIKRELWESSAPLSGGQSESGKPLFDTKPCEKCDSHQLLKYPWGGNEEKKPRCTNKKCWGEKQDAAAQAASKELLVELAKKDSKPREKAGYYDRWKR
jgi:ParB family chromosome partitioning protein